MVLGRKEVMVVNEHKCQSSNEKELEDHPISETHPTPVSHGLVFTISLTKKEENRKSSL